MTSTFSHFGFSFVIKRIYRKWIAANLISSMDDSHALHISIWQILQIFRLIELMNAKPTQTKICSFWNNAIFFVHLKCCELRNVKNFTSDAECAKQYWCCCKMQFFFSSHPTRERALVLILSYYVNTEFYVYCKRIQAAIIRSCICGTVCYCRSHESFKIMKTHRKYE